MKPYTKERLKWKEGRMLDAKSDDAMAEVFVRLTAIYDTHTEGELWYESKQKIFDGRRPSDMVENGQGEEVIRMLDQMIDGSYM